MLIAGLAPPEANVFMVMPGQNNQKRPVFCGRSLIAGLGDVREVLLSMHAMTGCDTTSSLYKMGKHHAFRLLKSSKQMKKIVSIFMDKNACKEDLERAGEAFLVKLYGGVCSHGTEEQSEVPDPKRKKTVTSKWEIILNILLTTRLSFNET